ncbi:adenylate/guanylate cyclase domain-containing protein [bacterium]|nr:adenylate/guanylate cyclase domain-containing protein [bacterium]
MILFYKVSIFQQVENTSLDFRFKNFTIEEKADTNIVLVAIDDQSLEFANQNGTFWPWPREFYALITNYLTQCGAKQIIFDIQFNEADYNRGDLDSQQSDLSFAQSIQNNRKVILSAQALGDTREIKKVNHIKEIKVGNLPNDYPTPYKALSLPIELFSKKALGVGLINVIPDTDGVVRKVPLITQINGKYYPQISLIAWLSRQDNRDLIYEQGYLRTIKEQIPLLSDYNYLINWYGKGDVNGVFNYIPFSALAQSAVANKYQTQATIETSFFKDKTIIIGATAPGLLDLKTTPVSKITPGMEIWATILSNLTNSDFVQVVSDFFIILIIMILVLLIILSFNYQRTLYAHLELGIIILIMHLVIYFLWIHKRIYLPWFIFILTILTTYIIMLLINYLSVGREKLELKRIFSRYIHPDLVDILINSSADFELGGKEVEASVLFSDIYDFTNYSENMEPKNLVTELNNYFEKFTEIILSNHGMLDKFTGDGLMALFGSPLVRIDHANLACKVALEHKRFSDSLADDDVNSHFNKKTRIGINTGTIVIGNIGSSQRTDYTAIGDAVNLSARLEGVNKLFKTSIIIGQTTWEQVKENYTCRELDQLKVKGKEEATRIYELICSKEESNERITFLINNYEKALRLYQKGHFPEAEVIFNSLFTCDYQDYPSFLMAERCSFLIKNPPENWDGIFTLTVK